MRKALSIIRFALQIVMCIFVAILLIYNICAMVQRAQGKNTPVVFGYSFSRVISGSMEPTIMTNDVVVVKSQKEYHVDDIIMFIAPDTGAPTTHRIIEITEDGKFKTKGDYIENDPDPFAVSKEAVIGKVVDVWAGAGKLIQKMQTPLGIFVIIAIGVVFWIVMELIDRFCLKPRKQKDEQNNEQEKQGE